MSRQNIFIIVLVVALGAGAYFWFGPSLFTSSDIATSGAAVEFTPLLQDLSRIEKIALNTEILKQEKFKILAIPVVPALPDIKFGRRIPFLPFR